MSELFIQHPGKVVSTLGRYTHVMAIALDPRSDYREGVIRCITSREGDVSKHGFLDRSALYRIRGKTLEGFEITDELKIMGKTELIAGLRDGLDFIGLEDPDIWIDESSDLLHLYFTIPLINKNREEGNRIHLGHAVGKDLDSMEMTVPALAVDDGGQAKELSIAPINKQGFRYNLVESRKDEEDFTYSTVRIAIAEDMGKPWKFGDTVFHPKERGIHWIGGHASPGPLFPPEFIDVGEGKRLGIMNGREANRRVDKEIKYGVFSVGLFIYDYECGKIDWVSPEPLIRDTEAKTITFASQFIETGKGEGILYAHVDDSFVRAYTLSAESIKTLLPKP